ncbi:MAG: PAS domain S-box protein [Pseudomonadota bacterium]
MMKPDLVETVLNSSTELAIIATCPAGVIQVFNTGAEIMLGYSAAEMIGRTSPAIFHDVGEVETYGSALSAKYHEVITGFRVFVTEPERLGHEARMWSYIRKNGSRLTVNLTITTMRDSDQQIIGYMGIAQDISKIRSLESALLISDQRFSDAFHSAAHGMGLVSVEGRWLDANESLCRIFGYSKNQLLLLDFQTITHPDDLQRDLDMVNQLLAGDIPSYQMEKRYFHADGSLIYALLSVSLVRDSAGVPIYFVSQIQDFTHKRAAELQSQSRQKYLQLVVDTVADGIISLDANYCIETTNPGVSQILACSQDDMSGLSIFNFMQHDDAERFREACQTQSLHAGQAASWLELQGQRLDGSLFELECQVSGLVIDGAQKSVVVLRDITQRKRMEHMKSEFVSTVSHELRTPLTAIKGSLELISLGAVGEVDETVKPIMDVAIRNTLRLASLINDLLDLDKLACGKLELELRDQSLMPIVEDAIALNMRFAAEYRVSLALSSSYDCWVHVDVRRLHQILANFLSNAAKFSPFNSEVDISVMPVGEMVRIAIRDLGPGIKDDFKDRLFTRFSQGDGSDRRRNSGTGLGLAISKELALAMKGQIGCISKPAHGSTFYLDLPCRPADLQRPAAPQLREVS